MSTVGIRVRTIKPYLLLLIVAAVALIVLVALKYPDWSTREVRWIECQSHAQMVALALRIYVDEHGWVPTQIDGVVTGFENVSALEGTAWNCPLCAPDRRGGGRTMLLTSRAGWEKVLGAFVDHDMPVVWCDFPHKPIGRAHGRTVVVLPKQDHEALENQFRALRGGDSSSSSRANDGVRFHVVRMDEGDFQGVLGRLHHIGWPSELSVSSTSQGE